MTDRVVEIKTEIVETGEIGTKTTTGIEAEDGTTIAIGIDHTAETGITTGTGTVTDTGRGTGGTEIMTVTEIMTGTETMSGIGHPGSVNGIKARPPTETHPMVQTVRKRRGSGKTDMTTTLTVLHILDS